MRKNSLLKSIVSLSVFAPVMDILLTPLVFFSAHIMLAVRRIGFKRLAVCKKILLHVGVMPIRNHYYEPLFDGKTLKKPLSADRNLPGIDWNLHEQISILNGFHFNEEFKNIPADSSDQLTYYYNNAAFGAGSAEYWYNIIRFYKPKKIIEIGSGHSTKIARLAIANNKKEGGDYQCEHFCIEPYEMPWLEKLGVTVIRDKVENLPLETFSVLDSNDILFIDSSHMIRPQGDVLFEYLEVLPSLKKGVIVHIHDIFSPKDYPGEWIIEEVRFWNEQYLLEAFLTNNNSWKIIGALNYLYHNHFDLLKSKCPGLTPDRESSSFYIQKQ